MSVLRLLILPQVCKCDTRRFADRGSGEWCGITPALSNVLSCCFANIAAHTSGTTSARADVNDI